MNDALSSAGQINASPTDAGSTPATRTLVQPVSQPGSPLLTTDDHGLLTRLERQLASGKTPLLTSASALATIKRKGLARFYGLSFHEYCSQRLRLKRSRVHQLLEFAELVDATAKPGPLSQIGNERQLRPLRKLPREDWADAWAEAVETAPAGKLTGKHVHSVVEAWLSQRMVDLVKAPPPESCLPPAQSNQLPPKPTLAPTMSAPSTMSSPKPVAHEFTRTVPAPDVVLPGWKEPWVQAVRDTARPPASLRSGVFGWQPAY